MSRSLYSVSKFVRPQSEIGRPSSFAPSQLLPRNIGLRYTRTSVRPGPLLVVPTACVPLRSSFGSIRHYANFPGGMPQGFPGLGQQQQKGDALKEYVRSFYVFFSPWNQLCILLQSVDLTEMAKEGKLDPTIGRDEGMYILAIPSRSLLRVPLLSEIRRTIQSKFFSCFVSFSQKVVSCYFVRDGTG